MTTDTQPMPAGSSHTIMSDDYRVQLDAYEGPLDLLLYLVKRHEIDLHDIPMTQLTEQYLDHLKVIRAIDVEVVGEFLVMAATLLEIKSRMLVPPIVSGGEDGEGEGDDPAADATASLDPRHELVQQLLAYKRYKDAALELEFRKDDWARRFPAHPFAGARHDDADTDDADDFELDLEDVHVLDLCSAFARILDSIGDNVLHEVAYDDTPISLHAEDIYDRLVRDGAMTLQTIFEGRTSRSELIGLFLAVLELVRNRQVTVQQEKIGGEIMLEALPEDQQVANQRDEPADWTDPETGEVQYDWPDPEAKAASEARARRRADRLRRRMAGEEVEDDDEDAVELETEDLDEMLGHLGEDDQESGVRGQESEEEEDPPDAR